MTALERADPNAETRHGDAGYSILSGEEGGGYRELVMYLPEETYGRLYSHSHWAQQNPLFHVRFHEGHDSGALVIDEIQSDWHQAGHKEGYRPKKGEKDALQEQKHELIRESQRVLRSHGYDDLNALIERVRELQLRRTEMKAELDGRWVVGGSSHSFASEPWLRTHDQSGPFVSFLDSRDRIVTQYGPMTHEKARAMVAEKEAERQRTAPEALSALEKEWVEAMAVREKHDELHREAMSLETRQHRGVEWSPFAKNWNEVAIKRMLRYAVDNGYNQIMWPPGYVHAYRWGYTDDPTPEYTYYQKSEDTFEYEIEDGEYGELEFEFEGNHFYDYDESEEWIGHLRLRDHNGNTILNQEVDLDDLKPLTDTPSYNGSVELSELRQQPWSRSSGRDQERVIQA